MTNLFQILDLSHARNIYAVGDIHGCYTMLEEKLSSLDFDPEQDHLISVGDLVDRGPENERAIEFCAKPWFHWVLGNHEEMMAVVAANTANPSLKNGQMWINSLMPSQILTFSETINNAPIILEVITPSGKRCGFVHACFPSDDWRHAEQIVADKTARKLCVWDRVEVFDPKPNGIRNIDWVFHGHTPLNDPRTVGNVVWIDTAAYHSDGKMTVVKLP